MTRQTVQVDDGDGVLEYPELRPYLVGIVERCGQPPTYCYDRSAVVAHFAEEFGDYDDAVDYVDFNLLGLYAGVTTPFFLDRTLVAASGGTAPSPDGSALDP